MRACVRAVWPRKICLYRAPAASLCRSRSFRRYNSPRGFCRQQRELRPRRLNPRISTPCTGSRRRGGTRTRGSFARSGMLRLARRKVGRLGCAEHGSNSQLRREVIARLPSARGLKAHHVVENGSGLRRRYVAGCGAIVGRCCLEWGDFIRWRSGEGRVGWRYRLNARRREHPLQFNVLQEHSRQHGMACLQRLDQLVVGWASPEGYL